MILFWKNKDSCGGLCETAGKVRRAEQNRTERHIRVVLQRWRRGMTCFFHFVLTLPPSFSRSLSPCSSHLSAPLHLSGTGMDTLLDKGSSVHNTGGGTFHCAAIGCCKPHISLFTPSRSTKKCTSWPQVDFEWCYTPQKLWARAALRKPLIHRATDLVGQLQSSVSFYTGEVRGAFQKHAKNNTCLYLYAGEFWWNRILMFSCSDWLLHGGSCVSIEMLIWGTDGTEYCYSTVVRDMN